MMLRAFNVNVIVLGTMGIVAMLERMNRFRRCWIHEYQQQKERADFPQPRRHTPNVKNKWIKCFMQEPSPSSVDWL